MSRRSRQSRQSRAPEAEYVPFGEERLSAVLRAGLAERARKAADVGAYRCDEVLCNLDNAMKQSDIASIHANIRELDYKQLGRGGAMKFVDILGQRVEGAPIEQLDLSQAIFGLLTRGTDALVWILDQNGRFKAQQTVFFLSGGRAVPEDPSLYQFQLLQMVLIQ